MGSTAREANYVSRVTLNVCSEVCVKRGENSTVPTRISGPYIGILQ
jgi:hypothetical protein